MEQTPAMPSSEMPEQTPTRKKRWLLWGLVALALLAIVAGALYVFVMNRQTPTQRAVYRDDAKICQVYLNHLKCVDKQGANPVRYDLPAMKGNAPVQYMFASRDRDSFVAVWNGTNNWPQFTLLDRNLKVVKDIELPKDMQAINLAFSQDGKSLLIEMGPVRQTEFNSSVQGQIYRYDTTKGSFTKLTKESDGTAALPYEMPDGRIIFTRYGAAEPHSVQGMYAMDADGKNAHRVKMPIDNVNIHYSYDAMTDQLFAFGTDQTDMIWYGTLTDFEKGTFQKVKNATDSGYQPLVFALSPTEVLLESDHYTKESIVRDLKSGATVRKMAIEGPLVGVMTTDKFTKSAQQEESKFERILGLHKTPADFQTFIKPVFEAEDNECKKLDNGKAEYEVTAVVADRYVGIGASCSTGGGTNLFFSKVDDIWKLAYSRQDIGLLSCSLLDEFKVTKLAESQCLDASGKEVANQNP